MKWRDLGFVLKLIGGDYLRLNYGFDDLDIIVDDELMTKWDNLLNLRFRLGLRSAYTIMIKKVRIIEHMLS